MQKLVRTALFLDLALWLGASAYFALMAANELFAGLPEDQAAAAVGILFPPFFTLCTILGVVGWVLYWWNGRLTVARGKSYWTVFTLLLLAAMMAIVNRLFMLPHIESIEQRMGPISKASSDMLLQFGMWHGISLLLAMVSIAILLVVWIVLSMPLKFTWSKGV